MDPSHLAYFGTHTIVFLVMRCWRRHASASTLLWRHASRIRSHQWFQCESWVVFWLQLRNGYANRKSLPKHLLSAPYHKENQQIPEPGNHVHDYTCIYHKPDWLATVWWMDYQKISSRNSSVCKTQLPYYFSIWGNVIVNLLHSFCFASFSSSQISDWIQRIQGN